MPEHDLAFLLVGGSVIGQGIDIDHVAISKSGERILPVMKIPCQIPQCGKIHPLGARGICVFPLNLDFLGKLAQFDGKFLLGQQTSLGQVPDEGFQNEPMAVRKGIKRQWIF
ncbi:hypothetical protein [Mesorhizobium sp.]|uniref:hypothetical protein n=1 Tax=Mesorhizobium sp. TaxID=1871066 RepID=UPI003BABD95C